MPQIFLDTSFAIALAMADDLHHERALEFRERLKQDHVRLLTTSAIVLEIGDGLTVALSQNRVFRSRVFEK